MGVAASLLRGRPDEVPAKYRPVLADNRAKLEELRRVRHRASALESLLIAAEHEASDLRALLGPDGVAAAFAGAAGGGGAGGDPAAPGAEASAATLPPLAAEASRRSVATAASAPGGGGRRKRPQSGVPAQVLPWLPTQGAPLIDHGRSLARRALATAPGAHGRPGTHGGSPPRTAPPHTPGAPPAGAAAEAPPAAAQPQAGDAAPAAAAAEAAPGAPAAAPAEPVDVEALQREVALRQKELRAVRLNAKLREAEAKALIESLLVRRRGGGASAQTAPGCVAHPQECPISTELSDTGYPVHPESAVSPQYVLTFVLRTAHAAPSHALLPSFPAAPHRSAPRRLRSGPRLRCGGTRSPRGRR